MRKPSNDLGSGGWTRASAIAAMLVLCGAQGDSTRGIRPLANTRTENVHALGVERHFPDPYNRPQEAAELFLRERLTAEMQTYPVDHMRRVLESIRQRESGLRAQSRDQSGPGGILGWRSIGPGNIGGRTRALAIDPVTPELMYAGGVSGGVWKSTDAGDSWYPADDLMLNLAISTIAIDPVDPSVVYAGTGEGFFWPYSMARGLGIFRSTDAGATWRQLEGTVSGVPEGGFHYVHDLVVSSVDHRRLYAATQFGVWRSDDRGESWTLLLANPRVATASALSRGSEVGCTDIELRSDRDPEVVLAAFGVYDADGLYRSTDGGSTWSRVLARFDQGRMSLAVAPSNNDVVYAVMAANSTADLGRLVDVYRSTDGGRSWQPRVDKSTRLGRWLLSNAVYATRCAQDYPTYHQGWYDNVVAVDPLDEDTVWVGGIDLFRSTNGGRSFDPASFWWAPELPGTADGMYVHADQHALVFHPFFDGVTNQILYSGSDGGLARTTTARAPSTAEECPFTPDPQFSGFVWTDLNRGYEVTQFYHGDSAAGGDLFVGGTQDNGTVMVDSRSTPDGWRRIYGGDGGYVAFDPRDDDTFYVEMETLPRIAKTTDGGVTFTDVTSGITDTDGLFVVPFAMAPSNPDVLWTGGSRPWRTVDGATSWTLAGPSFGGQISAIACAPSYDTVVYIGLASGGVRRTQTGLSPQPQWDVVGRGLPVGWVSSIAVDPQRADRAYCTFSTFGVPHVFRTDDGGRSWRALDGVGATGVPEIPVHWVAVRPCDSTQIYLGTEFGVFASDDRGDSWKPANHGFAHTVVEALDFKDDDTLVAFSRGRGAFVTELEPCPQVGARRPAGRRRPR